MEATQQFPKILHETPVLECLNKQGQRQFWQGVAATRQGCCYYYTISWHETNDGSLSARTTSTPNKITGKNVGRANETTDEEQTVFEVSVLERKKREKGYHEEGQESTATYALPMLAHTYFDTETIDKVTGKPKVKKGHKSKILWPCYAQPKYDGFRCIMSGSFNIAWSRTGKLWKPEVMAHLMFDTNGSILDGEIMLPLDMEFELLKTATSNYVEGLTNLVGYHVYDCLPDGENIQDDTPYEQRYRYLQELFRQAEAAGILPPNVYLVKSVTCESAEEAEEKLLPKALNFGYEGLILRNAQAPYLIKHRSYDLQKVKLFREDEFVIMDCVDGSGSDEEAIMYVCETKEGKQFTVRPKGSIPSRKKLWYEHCAGTYDPVGKMLTVEFFMFTKYGVPRFPKGKAVRDYE
jgi:DNA ligase-1